MEPSERGRFIINGNMVFFTPDSSKKDYISRLKFAVDQLKIDHILLITLKQSDEKEAIGGEAPKSQISVGGRASAARQGGPDRIPSRDRPQTVAGAGRSALNQGRN